MLSPDTSTVSWRVSPNLTWLKVGGAAAFGLATLVVFGDPVRLALSGLAALVLGGYALRDLLAPVRLAADSGGVTVVHGFAGHRLLPWAEIERIRVDERRRLGAATQLLEIDTSESLYLFSRAELNASCAEVVAALELLRARTVASNA